MSVTNRRKHERRKEGAGCAPFFAALALIVIIMISVLLALIVADALHITMAMPIIMM